MAEISRLDFVLWYLQKNIGKLPVIAAKTGVPHTTVKNLASGRVKDPKTSTLDKLYAHARKAA